MTGQSKGMTVIIPANNEEEYISDCLDALTAQAGEFGAIEVIVAANNCHDKTVEICELFRQKFHEKTWTYLVLDIADAGKVNALNEAERKAEYENRLFLDADVICSRYLLRDIASELQTSEPRYATGKLIVKKAQSGLTARYARCWQRLPFVKGGAVGAGLFAVNLAGRKRWEQFPNIISDDTFVRLNFAPSERVEVSSSYEWPMIEGLRNLIKVRRRQDIGVWEVYERWPELKENEGKFSMGLLGHARVFAQGPVDYAVYAFVQILTKLTKKTSSWERGR